ncbi:Putative membrane-associated zinc metalloprotease [Oceaniovalibus guishaninsula JLT2003]|uniref:Zinc metalloprotease n=1 Tax=Oceaniovalibus guishaninsula JLT2003 TaxID=1231392 RepID=K2I444_9RHOB|nr:RIP metalloprotease RseP [Oceaniovalibus guishaninsula]EKE43615.1 Putative membrane-associated zinc metalloprotease [Oceaniovalibus guishaninsula JLT2003]
MDIIGLIPSFGGLLYTVAAFVVALSVIVAIHEYGHYIVGRWTGIRADVFSIGFGPVLFSRRDRRGTLWQVAALPLGGYVKFRGDADAASVRSADTPGLDAGARRETMAGAPVWARALTVAAGPAFNFALSILIFAAVLLIRGIAADPLTVDTLRPLPGAVGTLAPGDEILAIEGMPTPELERMDGFIADLPVAPELTYRVLRDGVERSVTGPYPYPPLVGGVSPQSAAMAAGLREGDVIVSIDGRPVAAFDELREIVGASDGAPLELGVWRPLPGDTEGRGTLRDVTLTPKRMDLPLPEGGFETRWLIGITGGLWFTPRTQMPGVVEALGYGVDQTVFIVQSSLSGLYHMAAGAISSCNLSGPIGIAQTSSAAASQGLLSFAWFIAVLSAAVGLLNLFPIPVLDGGHLVFHAWEAVTGRPPGDRALNVLMTVGLALLGTLMVFALTNDIFCP